MPRYVDFIMVGALLSILGSFVVLYCRVLKTSVSLDRKRREYRQLEFFDDDTTGES